MKNLHTEWIQQIKCNGFMILGFLWTRSEKVNSRARIKCWILKRKRTLILRPVSNVKLHMRRLMRMQMRENNRFSSLPLNSAPVKVGVWNGPLGMFRLFHMFIFTFFVFFENAIDNKCVAINTQLHKEFTRWKMYNIAIFKPIQVYLGSSS